jgi:hypothetical protein
VDRRAAAHSGEGWQGHQSAGAWAVELTPAVTVNGQGGSGDDCDVICGLTEDRTWLASSAMITGLSGGQILTAWHLRMGESERSGCGGTVLVGGDGTLL